MPDSNPKAARARQDGKPRLELIDTALTHPTAAVLAHGAEKYGTRNWRLTPIHLRTYIGALRRHTDAIANGEWLDPDSGQPHMAHIAATCNVVLDADEHGTLVNDYDFAETIEPASSSANQPGGEKLSAMVCARCEQSRGWHSLHQHLLDHPFVSELDAHFEKVRQTTLDPLNEADNMELDANLARDHSADVPGTERKAWDPLPSHHRTIHNSSF